MSAHSPIGNDGHGKLEGDLMHPRVSEQSQEDDELVVHISTNDGEVQEADQNSNTTCTDSQELVDQEVISITGNENGLLSIHGANEDIQVLSNSGVTTVTDNNGAIYLLVSNDATGNMINTTETSVNVISADTLKDMDTNSNSTVQIMNSEGIPVNINVNDLLSTINSTKPSSLKDNTSSPPSTQSLLNLCSLTSAPVPSNCSIGDDHETPVSHTNNQYVIPDNVNRLSNIPNWALHLRDCTLFGDTYTGYVTDEVEMDNVLNLYKKETQSLFAIRQTPSPSKEESTDTVRLMWKSQYVPYDGIPFVNVGRRATVMECEYGPRKRNNALKRLIQLHGREKAHAKIPNLTCPTRLFVKKVRKFPQFQVPSDVDPKVLRQQQEQALKLVRQHGFVTGEIRYYMQLPLPSAHRYHHVGNSFEPYQKEVEHSEDAIVEPLSVDSRVLERIQQIVREGFVNPFLVRAAAKDFVENQMELGDVEELPYKHNKEFYPPLIEIQNIIQQTQAAINAGVLAPLPHPTVPPVTPKSKRKRNNSDELLDSPHLIKKMSLDKKKHSDGMVSPTIPSEIGSVSHTKNVLSDTMISAADEETISLTLTDSQLENFSVTNFTYSQLAQLAKIGLIALNNATKDTVPVNVVQDGLGFKTCDKGITLVNQPLPDCESSQQLLVTCNDDIVVKNEKIGILSNINDLDTSEITVDVVQYK